MKRNLNLNLTNAGYFYLLKNEAQNLNQNKKEFERNLVL